ncbi:hypothetical protein T439DRAFT_347517 [Meredithblackwellia eburnea MCA 4105]
MLDRIARQYQQDGGNNGNQQQQQATTTTTTTTSANRFLPTTTSSNSSSSSSSSHSLQAKYVALIIVLVIFFALTSLYFFLRWWSRRRLRLDEEQHRQLSSSASRDGVCGQEYVVGSREWQRRIEAGAEVDPYHYPDGLMLFESVEDSARGRDTVAPSTPGSRADSSNTEMREVSFSQTDDSTERLPTYDTLSSLDQAAAAQLLITLVQLS